MAKPYATQGFTPMAEIKVQQMNAMFSLGQSRSHVSLAEEQEVRNRWRLLKQKADVCASSVNPPD
jgi:hypothetical protein